MSQGIRYSAYCLLGRSQGNPAQLGRPEYHDNDSVSHGYRDLSIETSQSMSLNY